MSYKQNMANIPHHVGEVLDDIDDRCWFTHKLISSVIDEHAPIKQKKPVKDPVLFMNSQLRKAWDMKAMLQNRYFKNARKKTRLGSISFNPKFINKIESEIYETIFRFQMQWSS